MLVAPSPKKVIETCPVPLSCADWPAPTASGSPAPTMPNDPMSPRPTSVMCIEPPSPRLAPVARPNSSAKAAAGGMPRAMQWPCPR